MFARPSPAESMERIAQAPDATARAVLKALCHDLDIQKRALVYLDRIEATQKQVPNDDPANRKRKAESEIHLCVQCENPFYEEDNHSKACEFHEGELECDPYSGEWADWDENCHGDLDTPYNREEYPNGFTWTCCEKRGSDSPCTRGRHQAEREQRPWFRDDEDVKDEKEEESESSEDEDE
ncbi:hypothetical protein F4780DRAFT_780210 [Xylariomycetidae sp. FL0641]|nr:hypothetical protein F4780DRAFT_780210 [Xylariomycetidae sp. FL0641]